VTSNDFSFYDNVQNGFEQLIVYLVVGLLLQNLVNTVFTGVHI